MTQDTTVAVATIAVAAIPPFSHTFGHWGRFFAFLFTAGFAYPNVMTEGMDYTKLQKAPIQP